MANGSQSNDQKENKTDKLINSYLDDLFLSDTPIEVESESPVAPVIETKNQAITESSDSVNDFIEVDETDDEAIERAYAEVVAEEESRLAELDELQREAFVKAATIEREHSLTTTIDVMAAAKSKAMLTKPQSFQMLLISLYYLRRPLPEGVKKCFLEVSERMLEDYEAADWQAQVNRTKGVLREAQTRA